MKWMGWSWDDLQTAPVDVVREIVKMVNEEVDAIDAAIASRG